MSDPQRPDQSLLRAAFELSPIGVLVASADGRITWPNHAFCAMVGRSREELLQVPQHRLVHTEDRLSEQVHARRLLSGEVENYQIRKRYLRRDGTIVHALQTAHLVGEGEDLRFVAHVVDITEQVLREAELGTHERMRTVGRLAGSIAHDFNNLLTAIQANSAMVAEMVDDPDARDMLADVLAAAETGARLTDRLLGFSRGAVTRSERVDLAALVQDRHPSLRALVPGVCLTVEAEGPAWVFGDAQQLEQVLLNLVANARRASSIRVRVVQRWGEVLCDVVDDGPGMPEAVRVRAFEPYFTTRGEDGGTGLGLTTVYGVITGHSGTVSIDSALGRGTTVHIRLPAVEAPSGEQEYLGDSVNIDPRGRHIALVVDDDGPVRRAVCRALRGAGCEVLEANGVQTALARFGRHGHRLSLVVTDVVMHDGNGPDLVQKIRAEKPKIGVLYMSGYDAEELAAYAIDPKQPMLRKPFHPEDVVAAVIKLLT